MICRSGPAPNSLKDLPAGIFAGLGKLQTLYLTGNSLDELPKLFLSGVLELVQLAQSEGSRHRTASHGQGQLGIKTR